MSQSSYKYLLNAQHYPNMTSMWTKENLKPSITPQKLANIAKKYLAINSIDWDQADVSIIGQNFLANFSNQLVGEFGNCDLLGEFLILKWFTMAEFHDIDEDLRDVWLNWCNARAGRSSGHEAVNHIVKHTDEHLALIARIVKVLDTKSLSDREYAKLVQSEWMPISEKLKAFVDSNQKTKVLDVA